MYTQNDHTSIRIEEIFIEIFRLNAVDQKFFCQTAITKVFMSGSLCSHYRHVHTLHIGKHSNTFHTYACAQTQTRSATCWGFVGSTMMMVAAQQLFAIKIAFYGFLLFFCVLWLRLEQRHQRRCCRVKRPLYWEHGEPHCMVNVYYISFLFRIFIVCLFVCRLQIVLLPKHSSYLIFTNATENFIFSAIMCIKVRIGNRETEKIQNWYIV